MKKILCFLIPIIIVPLVFFIFLNTSLTVETKAVTDEKVTHSQNFENPMNKKDKITQLKRLNTDEQAQDDKGIAIPLSKGLGIPVDDIIFAQIFTNDFYHIQVFYIDTDKYPQFMGNTITYSEKVLAQLVETAYDENEPIKVIVYTKFYDLYYLRDLDQTTGKEINLELARLEPSIIMNYYPPNNPFPASLTACVKFSDKYKEIEKSLIHYNDLNWHFKGYCGYEEMKKSNGIWKVMKPSTTNQPN